MTEMPDWRFLIENIPDIIAGEAVQLPTRLRSARMCWARLSDQLALLPQPSCSPSQPPCQ